MSAEDLQKIPDIGPKVSQSIYDWFRKKQNSGLLKKLDKVAIRIENYKLKIGNLPLSGKSFVLTGTLQAMDREQAKEKIRSMGGDISESVSKKTSYVVAGENPGSKFDKAKKMGVKVLNEKEFLKLVT